MRHGARMLFHCLKPQHRQLLEPQEPGKTRQGNVALRPQNTGEAGGVVFECLLANLPLPWAERSQRILQARNDHNHI